MGLLLPILISYVEPGSSGSPSPKEPPPPAPFQGHVQITGRGGRITCKSVSQLVNEITVIYIIHYIFRTKSLSLNCWDLLLPC